MKIAFVADLHGNLPATLAMERELESVRPDEIWFLGDAVGKGPSSAATCDWVRSHCAVCIGGNWDYGIGGKHFPADEYYWDQLGPERLAWLDSLSNEAELTMGGIRFRLFHGRPLTPLLTVEHSRETLGALFRTERGEFGGVVFADSHRPFVRTLDVGYIMNTGSVGNSLGVPRAHALVLEGGTGASKDALRATVLSVPYDVEQAVRDADADLPNRDAYIREITTGVYARLNHIEP